MLVWLCAIAAGLALCFAMSSAKTPGWRPHKGQMRRWIGGRWERRNLTAEEAIQERDELSQW